MSSTLKLATEVAAMLDRDPILCDQVLQLLGQARTKELFPRIVEEIEVETDPDPVTEQTEALEVLVKPGNKALVLEAFRLAGVHA